MTDERRDRGTEAREEEGVSQSTERGEPGRTPGSAEGDRETVEESLREEEREEE